ncbi:MAG: hypothetical protein M0Z85_02300 [Gammaproteobacteria bacterium]|nr:hypothetical protein [Gammaproteobacteria bacterium]
MAGLLRHSPDIFRGCHTGLAALSCHHISKPFFDFYRDMRTGNIFVWAGHDGRHVRLCFLDAQPGDPGGVLEYDAGTFLGLIRRGVLEVIACDMITD